MKALLAALAVALAGPAFLWKATDGFQALTAEDARRVAAMRDRPMVPDIRLRAMSGEVIGLPSADRKVTMVEFIYTTCPTICQSAGTDLARVRDGLVEKGLGDEVRILSISFDPETDGPHQLSAYGESHGADGRIWTITRPDVDALPRLLRAFGVVVIPDRFGGYQHNAALHVVDPQGRLSAILDTDDITGALGAAKRASQ
ncbi:MAG: SCO family protein [Hyphomicrobium sp.]|nr:SCO family protein [Hyphomicrobium sp.]